MGRDLQVFVIEDNAADALMAKRGLERAGFPVEVTIFARGEEAFAEISSIADQPGETLPDLVLVDIRLPGMSGTEFIEKVKADPSLRHTPIVVFTSSHDEGDVYRAFSAGAAGYFTKGSGLEGLVKSMRTIGEFFAGAENVRPAAPVVNAE